MSEECPKCGSESIAGLMGAFWADIDAEGDTIEHWNNLKSNTEIGSRRMCNECNHEWGDEESVSAEKDERTNVERVELLKVAAETWRVNAKVHEGSSDVASVYAQLAISLEAILAEREELRKDKARLDWMDRVNANANERNETVYGWKWEVNHNRAMLSDCNRPALKVREAIDAAMEGGK